MTDFNHIEDEIDSIEQKIEMDYDGRNYKELDEDEQETVILDHFFKGQQKYNISAQKLRIGLYAYQNDTIDNGSSIEKITYKNGKSHYQVRNADGTFGKWVR